MTNRAIIIGVIWTLVLVGASLFVIIGFNGLPYEFIGRASFPSVNEAEAFQIELQEEATNAGASISTRLFLEGKDTKVTYIAHMTTSEPFEYGKRTLNLAATRIMQIVFTITYVTICILIWGDLKKKPIKEGK